MVLKNLVGIQSLNERSIKTNRGAQSALSSPNVGKANSNIESILRDILLGLEGTTPQQMKDEIEELLDYHSSH